MEIEKAKILDDILRRFKGNVTISWTELEKELGQTRKYFLTENNIKYLLGEGMLIENQQNRTLTLSDKGFATYTDIDKLGYVIKAKKEKRNNWIKNIGFAITIATFALLLYKTFYSQVFSKSEKVIEQSVGDKIVINLQTVDFIEIRNHSGNKDTIPTIRKRLTAEQTKIFIDKWNNAKSIGLYKFIPTYWLDIHLKEGTVRTFRINGQKIKEQKDWCFDLSDNKYIENLWTEIK